MYIDNTTGCPGTNEQPVHPLGRSARVLLTSVFGPYAQDDEFGSRRINPMELYHNQVTRVQGPFSLRMFHRSWGIMMIQNNISAPCALLDFPTYERFVAELNSELYDIIGISSIVANSGKVKKMCELIRQIQPQATIVIGGHVAGKQDLERMIDADYIVRGEGIRWFRHFVGDSVDAPIRHPRIYSGFGTRTMGLPLSQNPANTAATVIPSVGCPMGCNFCSTSHMFGGKGKFVHFYETGDELFKVMCELEHDLKVQSFFMMDENFLFHRERALRLLDLMQQHKKAWSLYVFSSAKVIRSYTMEQLLGLGVSWVWMGLEGKDSQYSKLGDIDTHALVGDLQHNGIRVLGSTIIGLEEHTPGNIHKAIEYAVDHDTEFHQFMLYTPIPGTPLYAQHQSAGTLISDEECPDADAHGQDRFKHRHEFIKDGAETKLIVSAFRRDFDINGPSVIRVARTILMGWMEHKNHPDKRIRRRFRREGRDLGTNMAAVLWASQLWFRHRNDLVANKIRELRRLLKRQFPVRARLFGLTGGPAVLVALWRENRRLKKGKTREPPTFLDRTIAGSIVHNLREWHKLANSVASEFPDPLAPTVQAPVMR